MGHDYAWSLVGTSCRSYTNNPSIDTSSLTTEQQTQKTLHKNPGKIKQSTAPGLVQKNFKLNEEKYLPTWPKQSKIISDRFKKKKKTKEPSWWYISWLVLATSAVLWTASQPTFQPRTPATDTVCLAVSHTFWTKGGHKTEFQTLTELNVA